MPASLWVDWQKERRWLGLLLTLWAAATVGGAALSPGEGANLALDVASKLTSSRRSIEGGKPIRSSVACQQLGTLNLV